MLTVSQKLSAYDEDASLCVDYLLSLDTCNGRVGATGMCLGGHLAYRCALDSRVKAAVCYFATDIHSKTLAQGKNDDSLQRAGDIKGELLMVSSCFFSLFPGFISVRWGKCSGFNTRNSLAVVDLRQKR
jgi:dienelactone hydrolase